MRTPLAIPFALLLAWTSVVACRSASKEPEPQPERPAAAEQPAGEASQKGPKEEEQTAARISPEPSGAPTAVPPDTEARPFVPTRTRPRKVEAKPIAAVQSSADDPLKGDFGLEQALQGIKGEGVLTAELKTEKGALSCELYEDKAPLTVANFVGLATGKRPWKSPDGGWVRKPAYDGTTFHRIIRGFMIQGGDAKGNGSGEPGYVIPDEVWEDAYHDERGLLCMANRGPNTNGAQFFILDGAAPHLDGGYTIFGKCEPEQVLDAIAASEVRGDRAVDPPEIKSVRIARKKAPAKK
jgi:peptidyl-prolyl cis-trans isomerase A (cyclophilin A)